MRTRTVCNHMVDPFITNWNWKKYIKLINNGLESVSLFSLCPGDPYFNEMITE